MNSRYLSRLRGLAVFCCLALLLMGFAREPVDTLYAIPVETVDSRLAYPAEIHVEVTDQEALRHPAGL